MNEDEEINNLIDNKKKNSKIIIAQIRENDVLIKDHQNARMVYENGYYGLLNKDKTLSLNFEEALHLLERGVIRIIDENNVWLEVGDCARVFMERIDGFWVDYLVFKDLRNRGYIIGRGINNIVKYRLYPRGAIIGKDVAKIMICPLSEGRSINLELLDKLVLQTQSLQKKLLIACVDRLGDVSYYEIQSLFNN